MVPMLNKPVREILHLLEIKNILRCFAGRGPCYMYPVTSQLPQAAF